MAIVNSAHPSKVYVGNELVGISELEDAISMIKDKKMKPMTEAEYVNYLMNRYNFNRGAATAAVTSHKIACLAMPEEARPFNYAVADDFVEFGRKILGEAVFDDYATNGDFS